MRIPTKDKDAIKRGDSSTLKIILEGELKTLNKTLRTSKDILDIRKAQGKLEVIDKLLDCLA